MKLWIRNQTRTEIMECNHLSVKETIIPNKKKSEWSIVANFGWVGAYESMERCLEIIDEIQELLILGNFENAFMHIHNCDMGYDETIEVLKRARETKAIITQGAEVDIKLPSLVVYEMPEN